MLIKSLFLILVYSISFGSFANYNINHSIAENKKSFNLLVSGICLKNSVNLIKNDNQINKALATYPKELALLYLKEFDSNNCYKSFSFLVKYLVFDYKLEVEKTISKVINKCILQSAKSKLCLSFSRDQPIFDLSLILGQICTKNTLKDFKTLNCHYKKSTERYCSLYQGLIKDSNKCPNFHLHQREVKELHHLYFSPSCPRKRWRKLNC